MTTTTLVDPLEQSSPPALVDPFEQRSQQLIQQIPTDAFAGISGEGAKPPSLLETASKYAASVPYIGGVAGGALRLAGKAPSAMSAIERGARGFAQALTPQSGKQLLGMTAGAGVAGASGEYLSQQAIKEGAPPGIAESARILGEIGPSMAQTAIRRSLSPVAESVRSRLYTIPQNITSQEKQESLSKLLSTGMQPLPSQIRQSRALSAIERFFQITPGSREDFIKFGQQNQAAANRAVAKAFGGTEPSLAPRAMVEADKALANSYNTLLSGKQINIDEQAKNSLSSAFDKVQALAEFKVGNKRVSDFIEAINAGNTISAPFWKEVRSEISRYVNGLDGPSKNIGSAVLREFDSLARRSLGEQDYAKLIGIDKKYAALKAFEDAFKRDPSIIQSGDVDINKFARQYAAVEPTNILYGRELGRGGEYVPLSEAVRTFSVFTRPKSPQTEATTLPGLMRAGVGLSAIGGGAMTDSVLAPLAGATVLAAPQLGRLYLRPGEVARRLRESRVSPVGVTAGAVTQEKE